MLSRSGRIGCTERREWTMIENRQTPEDDNEFTPYTPYTPVPVAAPPKPEDAHPTERDSMDEDED